MEGKGTTKLGRLTAPSAGKRTKLLLTEHRGRAVQTVTRYSDNIVLQENDLYSKYPVLGLLFYGCYHIWKFYLTKIKLVT